MEVFSENLEKLIIAQLLYFNRYLPDLLPKIKTEYFFTDNYKFCFNEICNLFYDNKPITTEIFLEHVRLKKSTVFDAIFDTIYNSKFNFSLEVLKEQITQLETLYLKRITKFKLSGILNRIKEYTNPDQILKDIQFTTQEIIDINEIQKPNQISEIMDLFETQEELIKTGFPTIDEYTQIYKKNLIIIGARPSIGKTTIALNIAVNIAKTRPVLFFSLEMSQKEIVNRIFSIVSNQQRQTILENKNILEYTKEKLKQLNLSIVDNVFSIDDIHQQIIKYTNNGVIFIDYLQLIQNSSRHRQSIYHEVTEISKRLKSIAKELNVVIFALAQLNRSLETRNDKKPVLSDLKDSGSIEQDADQVWLLYRDKFYNQDTEDNIEIIIAKNRSGMTSKLLFEYEPSKYKFYDRYK
jgi:replicative DNA helicase